MLRLHGASTVDWSRRGHHVTSPLVTCGSAREECFIKVHFSGCVNSLHARDVYLVRAWGSCAATQVDPNPGSGIEPLLGEALAGLRRKGTASEWHYRHNLALLACEQAVRRVKVTVVAAQVVNCWPGAAIENIDGVAYQMGPHARFDVARNHVGTYQREDGSNCSLGDAVQLVYMWGACGLRHALSIEQVAISWERNSPALSVCMDATLKASSAPKRLASSALKLLMNVRV